MKKILLVFALTFQAIWGYAQGVPQIANTIFVTLPDSVNANEKALKILAEKGFVVNIKNKNTYIVVTRAKKMENHTCMILTLEIKGHEIVMTGRFKSLVPIWRRAWSNYEKSTSAPMVIAWLEMIDISKAFGGKRRMEMIGGRSDY